MDNYYDVTPESTPPRPASPWAQAMGLLLSLGWQIAVPLVLFALLGRWADRHFHTSPWLLLAGLGLAIITSTLILIRKFAVLIRDSQQKQ